MNEMDALLRTTELTLAAGDDEPDGDGWRVLHRAVRSGDADLCRMLLRGGADREAPDTLGMTPLHHAVCSLEPSPPLVATLLAEGVDPNAQDHEGWTALHYVVTPLPTGDPSLVRLILDHGADPYRRDRSGKTALHRALERRFGKRY